MIKIKMIDKGTLKGKIVVLYADTKDEVPEASAEMTISGAEAADVYAALEAGTFLYTAEGKRAILKSDGTWSWIGETASQSEEE